MQVQPRMLPLVQAAPARCTAALLCCNGPSPETTSVSSRLVGAAMHAAGNALPTLQHPRQAAGDQEGQVCVAVYVAASAVFHDGAIHATTTTSHL